jgi:hypothetical protein
MEDKLMTKTEMELNRIWHVARSRRVTRARTHESRERLEACMETVERVAAMLCVTIW